MKILHLVLAATVMMSWTACSSDLDETGMTGSIAGSVFDMTTGEPVPTVNVKLSPGGKSTVTGSDGAFEFYDLEPGDYTFEINKEGYSPNTGSCTVRAGEATQSHLLIGRLTASLTADRTELDFGETLSTLSFSIVNRGYTDLEYKVEKGDCSWISTDPEDGVIGYGKTATVIVTIDRSQLDEGENQGTVIVRSTNGAGKVEIAVTATGEKKPLRWDADVETRPASNVTATTARLEVKFLSFGSPLCSEVGMIWSTDRDMTIDSGCEKFIVPSRYYSSGYTNQSYQHTAEFLTPGTLYWAKGYVIQEGNVLYSNEINFTTEIIPTDIRMSAVTDVTSTSATLGMMILDVGTPGYDEAGFCFNEYIAGYSKDPVITDNRTRVEASGTGTFNINVTGLKSNTRYMVRGYVIQGNTITYSSNCKLFNTPLSN